MSGIIYECGLESEDIADKSDEQYGMVLAVAFGIEQGFIGEESAVAAPYFVVVAVGERLLRPVED